MMRAVVLGLLMIAGVSIMALQETAPPTAHFHHVHVNSTNAAKTQQFYETTFGAQPVKFKGRTDALFVSRGFILITTVSAPPKDLETTAIRHIGWSGVDGPNEFEHFKQKGLAFHTPLTPLGTNWFFYLYGPDREIAEVYTGDQNHLFNHVHLSVDDVAATAGWRANACSAWRFPCEAPKALVPRIRTRAGAPRRAWMA